MKYAKVENGIVTMISKMPVWSVEPTDAVPAVTTTNDEGQVTVLQPEVPAVIGIPDPDWIEVDDTVFAGFIDDGNGGWTAPSVTPPTAAELRAAMLPLTRRQLLLGLLDSGITSEAVEAQIALIADDTERAVAEIEWANASEYARTHALIVSVGAALGLTESQIDTMWEAAALL
ncbi:hypothetical protein [Breoghania sp.]|uniref:hypothetical protein n=1 Tax=Breoghania sp. TaxID=2065378 RepID=UPI0029CA0B58|nr:hypothetical protein [Breoghania sp.]